MSDRVKRFGIIDKRLALFARVEYVCDKEGCCRLVIISRLPVAHYDGDGWFDFISLVVIDVDCIKNIKTVSYPSGECSLCDRNSEIDEGIESFAHSQILTYLKLKYHTIRSA